MCGLKWSAVPLTVADGTFAMVILLCLLVELLTDFTLMTNPGLLGMRTTCLLQSVIKDMKMVLKNNLSYCLASLQKL